jgi:AcrR family transcriptional regulator
MLSTAVRKGYAGASVAEAITHAGVSRPTFYEYFADKDDCFLAVHQEISGKLLARVSDALQAELPERAVQAGVRALILGAEAEPEEARFLVNETLAAGPRVLDQRDSTIRGIEQRIDRTRTNASPRASTPDLPTRALIGGIWRLLAPRLRRNEHDFRELADEVADWLDCYRQPTESHRWRTLDPGGPLPPSEHVAELTLRAPPSLPPGRPSLSSAEVTRNQRERIFYANFHDKQQAFLAIHELAFQQMMAVCASAFFSGSNWAERVWEGLRAGTYFNACYPVLSHIGYVEAHAVGSPAIQRVEDSHAAFTIFVQEGYLHTTKPPARSVLDAIAATIFEMGYHQARRRQIRQFPRLTPHASYLVLTPFLGRESANDFIDEKLRQYRRAPARVQETPSASPTVSAGSPQLTTVSAATRAAP